MSSYDAAISPHPDAWLALDEQQRLELVREYHRDIGEELPEERQNVLHAVAHVIVENQLALESSPTPETLARLMREGLDRHAAVHAIGSVLLRAINDGISHNVRNINAEYTKRLRTLTAKDWVAGR
jgi:hypothetical protein